MLLDRLRHYWGVHVVRIMSRPLTRFPGEAWRKNISIAYRLIRNERELLPHCANPDLNLPRAFVRAAFARGDICVAAFDGSRLVGYQWLAFGPAPHIDGIWVDCYRTARYGYKQFVIPEYRGQRIAAALCTHGDSWSRRRGCTHTVSFIDLDNKASWRASSRVGNRTVGYACYVELFGMVFAFRTAGVKQLGFRFYRPEGHAVPELDARPRIRTG